jgi:hypothetical protein
MKSLMRALHILRAFQQPLPRSKEARERVIAKLQSLETQLSRSKSNLGQLDPRDRRLRG